MKVITPTQMMAAFVCDSRHKALDPAVVHAVRRAILDSIGVTAAGTHHPASAKVIDMIEELGTTGPCRIVGSSHRTDPINAALANGASAHVFDWDDTILPTRAHLSAALLPPLIAEGEIRDWTIGEIIPAFAIGFEIAARINEAVYPSVHLRGWQGTGVAGGAGVAAAISRMLDLSPEATAHAMGIAATNASGLIATFGSMSKPLNIARAGASGLQSALLASFGFTSHPDIFGAGKFLEMFDDAPRHDVLLKALGEHWSILQNGYKPYPCGFVAHAVIDAVRDLRASVGDSAELRALSLRVSPESMQLMNKMNPQNELEAKFSLIYDAAVAWIEGNVSPAAFEDESIHDPRYRDVMSLSTITVDESVAQHEAFARADLGDGRKLEVHVRHARGTTERPMSDEDLRQKFQAGFEIGGFGNAEASADLIMTADTVPVGRILDHLASTAKAAA
jgi:2-methylcitrate dehydratase PrpD